MSATPPEGHTSPVQGSEAVLTPFRGTSLPGHRSGGPRKEVFTGVPLEGQGVRSRERDEKKGEAERNGKDRVSGLGRQRREGKQGKVEETERKGGR